MLELWTGEKDPSICSVTARDFFSGSSAAPQSRTALYADERGFLLVHRAARALLLGGRRVGLIYHLDCLIHFV